MKGIGQRRHFSLRLSIACFLSLISLASCDAEEFYEDLLFRPLRDGRLLTHFQFTIRSEDTSSDHYELFPKEIGQIVRKYDVEEFHLSLTQGRWFQDRWDQPIFASPPGVEFWSHQSRSNDSSWDGLVHALGGLYCGSLEAMQGNTVSSHPTLSFHPEGSNNRLRSSSNLRYSSLPREIVCTENLTPFLKLLPCRRKAGIATLLDPLRVFEAEFKSIGIHLRHICLDSECRRSSIELIQTLSIVFDISHQKEWTLKSIFGASSVNACFLSSGSNVWVQDVSASPNFNLKIQPEISGNGKLRNFDLRKLNNLTFTVQQDKVDSQNVPRIKAQRYFTGYGGEYGGLVVHVVNQGVKDVNVKYHDLVPWYLRIFFHSMQVSIDQEKVDPLKAFTKLTLTPSEDHANPSVIEFEVTLKPKSFLTLQFHFEKAFLHWTEFPPDAHRGFDIGSGTITVMEDDASLEWNPILYRRQGLNPYRVYTDALLVVLPTPDFSMPYNVITLTGCLFTLIFGTTFTTLVRRMKQLDRVNDEFVSNRPIARIIRALRSLLEGV